MPKARLIGITLLFAGFIASYFGIQGLAMAFLFWVSGTAIFARSFLR